jgi:uncharacterized membrane protein YeaQ/YmgE (transglycosylase-associated protein family)
VTRCPIGRYNPQASRYGWWHGAFGSRYLVEDDMAIEALLITLLIGAIAGWLAGQIVSGFGFGLLGNIVVGIVGAFIAGFLLPRVGLGLGGGILGAIISATIGAVILLLLVKVIKRA